MPAELTSHIGNEMCSIQRPTAPYAHK